MHSEMLKRITKVSVQVFISLVDTLLQTTSTSEVDKVSTGHDSFDAVENV